MKKPDFVHLHVDETSAVHLTLVDVTGHGLAAALTVNRLYGELERVYAESNRSDPGTVLTLLNRYINLTMRQHNIYATASCVMLDPTTGTLRWASGGHPPGYLRRANAEVRDLAATTVLLGALADDQFNPDQQTIEVNPGDTLIMFTDGAFEARDRTGQPFGLQRLREMVSITQPSMHWPEYLAAAISTSAIVVFFFLVRGSK